MVKGQGFILGVGALLVLALGCGESRSSSSDPKAGEAGAMDDGGDAGTAGSNGGAPTGGGGVAGAAAGGGAGGAIASGAGGAGGVGGAGASSAAGGMDPAGAAGSAGEDGGAGPGMCPATRPTESGCNVNGVSCTYERACCTDTYACSGLVWRVTSDCTPTECPATAPEAGSPCDSCENRLPCRYDGCGNPNGSIVTATCGAAGSWQLASTDCNAFPCGSVMCDDGQFCVNNSRCVDNPCVGQPLSCTCAQPVCGTSSSGYVCSTITDRTISCICLTC
jgi:hypothetical protein